MTDAIRESLQCEVKVPQGDLPQFTSALGCAILGHIQLKKLEGKGAIEHAE